MISVSKSVMLVIVGSSFLVEKMMSGRQSRIAEPSVAAGAGAGTERVEVQEGTNACKTPILCGLVLAIGLLVFGYSYVFGRVPTTAIEDRPRDARAPRVTRVPPLKGIPEPRQHGRQAVYRLIYDVVALAINGGIHQKKYVGGENGEKSGLYLLPISVGYEGHEMIMCLVSRVDWESLNLPDDWGALECVLNNKLDYSEMMIFCSYRSRSEGLWRCPARRAPERGLGPGYLDKGAGYTFCTLAHMEMQAVFEKWLVDKQEINLATRPIVEQFEKCHSEEVRKNWPHDCGTAHSYMLNEYKVLNDGFYRFHLYDEERQVREEDPRRKIIFSILPSVSRRWTRDAIYAALETAMGNVDELLRDERFSDGEKHWARESYRPALVQARENLHVGDDYSCNWAHMESWPALGGSWLAKWTRHIDTKDLHKRNVCGREFQVRSVLISFEGTKYMLYTMADTNLMRQDPRFGGGWWRGWCRARCRGMLVEVPFAAYAVEERTNDPGRTIYGTYPRMAMDFDPLLRKPFDYACTMPYGTQLEVGRPKGDVNTANIAEGFRQQGVFFNVKGGKAELPTPDTHVKTYNYVAHFFDCVTTWRPQMLCDDVS